AAHLQPQLAAPLNLWDLDASRCSPYDEVSCAERIADPALVGAVRVSTLRAVLAAAWFRRRASQEFGGCMFIASVVLTVVASGFGLIAALGLGHTGGWLAIVAAGLVPLGAGVAGLAFWRKRPMVALACLLLAAIPHVWLASDGGSFDLGVFLLP